MNRRTLIKTAIATATTFLSSPSLQEKESAAKPQDPASKASAPKPKPKPPAPKPAKKPKFQLDLCGGRVGIRASQEELIALAQKHGFASVEPLDWQLKKLPKEKLEEMKAKVAEAKLVWGATGLPVEFRKDEKKFQEDLKNLPACATALQTAGVTRMGTWIMPCHDGLTYRANFRQHAKRLKETAKVLEQHGIRLGLEYVGTKTLWTSKRFPFVHTMKETKELIAVIGQNNVGFVLDCWHWTMAGETAADIKSLKNKEVVVCDLNDAPAGIEIDQQIDNQRELPMATGVIDVKAFLEALVHIQFDGPIRAEPFNKPLNEMENDAAAAATAAAMKKALATLGA